MITSGEREVTAGTHQPVPVKNSNGEQELGTTDSEMLDLK